MFTFAFWFVVARFVGSEVVGIVSYISSLVFIISTINIFDLHLGMKRSLGIAISNGNIYHFNRILLLTTLLISVFVTISIVLIAIPNVGIWEILNIESQYLWIFILMLIVTPFHYVLIEALIAAQKSKSLVIPFILGCAFRFPLFFVFLYIFYLPTAGTLISYSLLLFVSTILFTYPLLKTGIRTPTKKAVEKSSLLIKETLRAGLSSWVPHVTYVLGTQLGIITTTAATGASDGGRFYIAFGIFMVTLFIIISITKVTHSLIAGMKTAKEQATFVAYSIKIGFIFTMPIAVPFFFFSGDILSLLGTDFSKASLALSILMLNMPFVIVSEIIYYFVYGKGFHRAVLILGLIGNLPRIILYFVLPSLIGVNGAALAYIVGSVMQFIFSAAVANKELVLLDLKSYVGISIIPIIIGLATWILGLNFLISSLIIIITSLVVYIRVKMIDEVEVKNITYTVLPTRLADSSYPRLLKIMSAIHR